MLKPSGIAEMRSPAKTERQRDRETEGQRDRETGRQRDRETEEREICVNVLCGIERVFGQIR